jgi:predicted nucleic acid-binding protein
MKRLESCLSNIAVVLEADSRMRCPIDLPKKDRAVLMAAISAKADYLLTGDNEYFGKYLGQTIMGVKISTPRDYPFNSQHDIKPIAIRT